MTSVYTAPLEDGKISTLKEYLLHCHKCNARGKSLSYRETVSDYYDTGIKKTKVRFDLLDNMSSEELAVLIEKEHEVYSEQIANSNRIRKAFYDKCQDMLAQVESWEPDFLLTCFKETAIEMLTQEHPRGWEPYLERERLYGEYFRKQELLQLSRQLQYLETEKDKDLERTASNNKFYAAVEVELSLLP